MKKIKIARIYKYNGSEYRVLIDRMWPRGIKKENIDLWFKDISPSLNIIKKYHQTDDYEEFKKEYINELNNNNLKVNKLINIIKSKDCVLLYSSKKEKNNGTILNEYLEKILK